MEQACTIWDPVTHVNTKEFELVQRLTAVDVVNTGLLYLFYSNDSNVMKKLYLPPLQAGRKRAKVAMSYQIAHQQTEMANDRLVFSNNNVITNKRPPMPIETSIFHEYKATNSLFSDVLPAYGTLYHLHCQCLNNRECRKHSI